MDYDIRRDMIVMHAWETWTKNGLNLDNEAREQTIKSVRDAVNNAYHEDMVNLEWLAATLKLLGET